MKSILLFFLAAISCPGQTLVGPMTFAMKRAAYNDAADVNSGYDRNSDNEVLLMKINGVNASLLVLLNERDRQYIQRFESIDKANAIALVGVRDATTAALAAAKEAVTKAETANEKRFESVNEFRGQLKDMITTLASKDEVNIRFKGMEDKILLLTQRESQAAGRSEGANWLWTVIAAVLGLVIGVLAVVVSLRASAVRARSK